MKYLFLFSLLIFACGKSPEETTQNLSTQTLNLSTYGNPEFIIPTLPDNVRAEVTLWGAFEDFEEQDEYVFDEFVKEIREANDEIFGYTQEEVKA